MLSGPARDWVRANLPRIPLLVNLLWGLLKDPRVPLSLKAALAGVLAYLASPIDLIPDFIPLIGQMDDLVLLFAALELFVRLAPREVVEEIEERYRKGHGPLRTDLENAERYLGRFWSWAARKVNKFAEKYASRVADPSFVEGLKSRLR